MAYLLGVDIGTSGTKTVLFDEQGATIASATGEYPMAQPQVGWAEQDPEHWWHAARDTIAQVVAKSAVNPRGIQGIGLSGQMHGMVLLGADHTVLRPAIIWCDQRTVAECEQIMDTVGRERLIRITCNPALTGFTAGKVMWVKNHQPEIFEKTRHILLPKDYVRLHLTGECATEVSDASGMQFLDVPNRRWSRELTDLLGIPFEWLPKVYESYEISGRLSAQAARETGLWAGMPVVGGGGDQAAGAVGNGIVRGGVISSTIGTSGVVFAHCDEVVLDPQGRLQSFCHAVPGAWHVMGVAQTSGLSLQWMRNEFCAAERELAARMDIDPYELIVAQAAQSPAGANGLFFLPYLLGERAPHLDSDARGVFFGISAMHTRQDMLRAVMEGVGYSLCDCLDIIRGLGIHATQIRASGGGGKSPLWRQIQADMFGADVVTTNSSQGPALGAALLAGVGTGLYASVPEACDAAIQLRTTQTPDAVSAALYARRHPLFRRLYVSLKDDYKALAALLRGE